MTGVRAATVMAISLLIFKIGALPSFATEGNAIRGQRIFGACAACHSLEPGKNMTGPSLSGLWGRKAGSLQSFSRYSSALSASGIVWGDKTLDEWIADPQHMVAGNFMTFPGIKEADVRAELIAFLKMATQPNAAAARPAAPSAGMAGMAGGGDVPNLKELKPAQRVEKITHCNDTYTVVTADGRQHKFWERNLRLKTDSSMDGPQSDSPALVGAGMMGDRADVIFANPSEISRHITATCQ